MRLPESRRKELLTIWYAATLTPRAKRLSKREIAAIDVANICNVLLDETKDPITLPVISSLLLGAAKVLRQQSLMIYSDVLHLWSRLQPRLFEPQATSMIDLPSSVAKLKNITLTELETIGSHTSTETHYPFADLFNWTNVGPPLALITDDSGSASSSAVSNIEDQQVYGDNYSIGEELNRMNDSYLLSPIFLEGDHRADAALGYYNNMNNHTTMPHLRRRTAEEEEAGHLHPNAENYSIPDLLLDDFFDDGDIGEYEDYGDGDDDQHIWAAIMDDQRRLLQRATSLPSLTGNRNPSEHRRGTSPAKEGGFQHHEDVGGNDANVHNDYDNGDVGDNFIHMLPPIVSQRSTFATEDMSGLVPVSESSSSSDENENTHCNNNDDANVLDQTRATVTTRTDPVAASTITTRQQQHRSRRTRTRRLISDTATTVPASFYQQRETLINRRDPYDTLINQRRTGKHGNAKKAAAIKQQLHRPLVPVDVAQTNAMWQHQLQAEIMFPMGMTNVELERARRNQQAVDDAASLRSSMDFMLNDPSSTGADQRFNTSRERSGSSASLLLGSSDDEEQRRFSRMRRSPEFSRVPEEDDYMDYDSGGGGDDGGDDDMAFPGTDAAAAMLAETATTTNNLHHDRDADGFLSYAQWMLSRQGEPVALETLLSPTAHRSEVAQAFYYLLVGVSRNKLQVRQQDALGEIQISFGFDMNMVNAAVSAADVEAREEHDP